MGIIMIQKFDIKKAAKKNDKNTGTSEEIGEENRGLTAKGQEMLKTSVGIHKNNSVLY